jgi:hypothetical protein
MKVYNKQPDKPMEQGLCDVLMKIRIAKNFDAKSYVDTKANMLINI